MLENINWTALSFGMSAVAMISNAALYLYVQVQKKHAATDKQVTDLASRVTVLETEVKALPSGQSWSEIRTDIAGIRGDLGSCATEIRGLGAGLKRVEGHVALLLENELRGKDRS